MLIIILYFSEYILIILTFLTFNLNFTRCCVVFGIETGILVLLISSWNLCRDIPEIDNYSVRLLPGSMRLADEIDEAHVRHFSNSKNVKQLMECKQEISKLLEEYTVDAMTNFLRCKPVPNVETGHDDRIDRINNLKTLYR